MMALDWRRTIAAAFATLSCTLTLAACAKIDPHHQAGAGRHSWTRPGHLRLGYSDEPDNLNPMFAHTAATDEVDALLFAPLFRYDQSGEFVPELATEVPTYDNNGISADGKTIVLHLRKGVTWADGAPLTARDLRFTWRAAMNPANNTKLRSGWDLITAMDLPNDYTAIVHLREPNADVLGIFGGGGGAAYPPLPEHLLGKLPNLNRAAFNAKPLSSGPWLLKAWHHGASLEFAPNPRYWRGPPKLKAITWKIVPNADTLLAQLQTHEIDVYAAVSENQIARLEKIDGITVDAHLIANYRHLEFNCRKPALSDVRVRRAIAEAVDWDAINRTVYHGYNLRAVSDIIPGSWAAPRIRQYRFDVEEAKGFLDRAGFRPGADGIRRRGQIPLKLTISTGTNRPANEQAEVVIQQQLRAVGIDLQIKNYPVSLLFAQNGPLYGGKYDLSWSIATSAPDPDNEALWSGKFIPPNGANTSFLNDPVLTKTSHDALRTFDRAKRKALYQQEEQRLHDVVPAVFLYWQQARHAYNSDLRGYKPARFVADNWNSWEWQI